MGKRGAGASAKGGSQGEGAFGDLDRGIGQGGKVGEGVRDNGSTENKNGSASGRDRV